MVNNLKIMTAIFAFSVSLMAMEEVQDEEFATKASISERLNKIFSSPVPDVVLRSRAIYEKEEAIRRELRIEKERLNGKLNAALASHYPIIAPYAGALAETEIALEEVQLKLGNFAKGVAKLKRTRENNQALRNENKALKRQIEKMKQQKQYGGEDDGF